jgi:hypothetical protein
MHGDVPRPTVDIPPPRHSGGDVLYLDFDSVLHPGEVYVRASGGLVLRNSPGHELFEHAPLLDRALLPYPGISIVLSTSWVRHYRGCIPRIAARLPPGLRDRVIGATFHSGMSRDTFEASSRGSQVCADVLRRKPGRWLAIDDDDDGWPKWARKQLVLTHKVLGISEPAVLGELQSKLELTFRATQ